METLRDKVALVTGASYGIGQAVAIALAREGSDVVLVARGKEGLQETAKRVEAAGRRAVVSATDVTVPREIQTMVQTVEREFGKLDILWNGTSGFLEESLADEKEEDISNLIDTTVKGTVLVTKALLPLLAASGDAHIINIVSDWALPGSTGPSPFTAAKFAVAGLGQSLARELLPQGIKVTNLFPGDVASDFDLDNDLREVQAKYGTSMISVNDIVSTVLFVLGLELARVPSITLLPLDPGYTS